MALLTRAQLRDALTATGERQRALHARAHRVRLAHAGDAVYFRGIIEFSNICEKNCSYCGIRRGNRNVHRYHMSLEEVLACVAFVDRVRYGSVVLQSGELTYPAEKEFLLTLVRAIRERHPRMGITLSLGEHEAAFLRQLRDAGAHRYLLRIETSVPRLYTSLHPADHSLRARKRCLRNLRRLGYQTGCGNMIGLPGQTLDDIIADLLYFVREDFDMFGLGPYVIHAETPLATRSNVTWWREHKEEIFQRTLNTIALLRILMPTSNIAAATALDVFHKDGREQALRVGANILMPSVTPTPYRGDYLLYQDKPCVDGNAEKCSGCIIRKVSRAGLRPVLDVQGTSKHFLHRTHGAA